MKLHKMTLTMVSQVSPSPFTCSHLILTPLRSGFYHHQHSPFTDEETEAQSKVTCTRSLRSEQWWRAALCRLNQEPGSRLLVLQRLTALGGRMGSPPRKGKTTEVMSGQRGTSGEEVVQVGRCGHIDRPTPWMPRGRGQGVLASAGPQARIMRGPPLPMSQICPPLDLGQGG